MFQNHQARCALLIPLRFEFANEFGPASPSKGHLVNAPTVIRRWPPPSAAFRPRGVTPNRGNNVASRGGGSRTGVVKEESLFRRPAVLDATTFEERPNLMLAGRIAKAAQNAKPCGDS
jgi:hypothetical protein